MLSLVAEQVLTRSQSQDRLQQDPLPGAQTGPRLDGKFEGAGQFEHCQDSQWNTAGGRRGSFPQPPQGTPRLPAWLYCAARACCHSTNPIDPSMLCRPPAVLGCCDSCPHRGSGFLNFHSLKLRRLLVTLSPVHLPALTGHRNLRDGCSAG